ncbi:hypothetical protein [Granulicella arctica]|uniref:hypothetical protein n=1 Tax=Granulicella arctica TaxID=940613 RepID=UPI0021E0B9B9|nr:hypothetical protein [Granulicella arctica]
MPLHPVRNLLLLFTGCIAAGLPHAASGQQTPLITLLNQNRYSLTVHDNSLTGPAAPFLNHLLAKAQFVAIGEDHGTREVPQFVAATCRIMASQGLDAMAIEAGPLAARKLQQWTADNQGPSSLAAFQQTYPNSIAIFNWRQEFDLLTQCQQYNVPNHLILWGLDQEYLGSPPFILQQILDTHPNPQTNALATHLLAQCSADRQKSLATHDWKDACIFQLADNALASLAHTSSPLARQLADALLRTHHIYTTHESGPHYDANRERSLLMKTNFVADYQQLAKTTSHPPRVLLKFGGNHLYKGVNQTNLIDLGNFLTEFADGLGSQSLHILVVGLHGENEQSFGPGQPDHAVPKDIPDGFMALLSAQALPGSWTVFDLHPLRSRFADLGPVDRELERLIFGYDVLILIPTITPETPIH